jgi:hypothetical protein
MNNDSQQLKSEKSKDIRATNIIAARGMSFPFPFAF